MTKPKALDPRQITDAVDLVGKTIAAKESNGDYLVLVFSDGTFAHLVVTPARYDDDFASIDFVKPLERSAMVRLGLLTQQDADREIETEFVLARKQQEERDRIEYERLKSKLGRP